MRRSKSRAVISWPLIDELDGEKKLFAKEKKKY
jgi:hypothetical protein